MVAGPDVYICDRCINDAAGIVRSDLASYHPAAPASARRASPHRRRLLPTEIKQALDEYVVGQDQAKKALSVAVFNHY
jgi:ATP-dependent Clp protease ATP-binding subunit ClpX